MNGKFASFFRMRAMADVLVVAALCALVIIGVRHASVSDQVPASVADTEFSTISALADLRKIAESPHPAGTPENAAVRKYILDRTAEFKPEVQTAVGINKSLRRNSAGLVHNIIVRIPGQAAGKALLVAAHYDSAPNSFGATDDGVGVAAMLETIRVIARGPRLKNDIVFLFTDAEESGLLGADAFAADPARIGQIGMALNFDYRGSRGPLLMFEATGANSELVKGFRQAPLALGNSLMGEIYQRMPNSTDMRVFNSAGIPGLNFAAIEGAVHYHTRLDSVDNVSPGSVHHTGETMLALVRHFGNVPMQLIAQGVGTVYFDLPLLGLVSYPASWAWPLTAIALGLLAGVVVVGVRRGQLRAPRTLVASAGLAGVVLLLAIASQLAWIGILLLHPGYQLMQLGDTYNSNWYLLAFAALFGGACLLVLSGLKKWLRPLELAAGGAFLWAALLVAATRFVPGATFVLLWPLLGVLISLLFVLSARAQAGPSSLRLSALLLGAAPGVLIFAPMIWQVFVALTPRLFGVPILLLLLLVVLAAPMVREFTGRRLIPAALALVGVLGIAIGAGTADFDARHPRPSNLSYIQHGAANAAFWLSSDAKPDAWTASFFQGVAQRRKLPEVFGERLYNLWAAPAPARQLALPTAELVDDQSTASERTVTLRVKSPRMAPLLTLEVEGASVLRSQFAGRAVTAKADEHWLLEVYGVRPEGALVTLVLKPGVPFKLRMIDSTYGLPLPADQRRPTGVQAQAFGDSDTTRVVAVAAF